MSAPRWTYDIFLSFHGQDTRYTFTDHVYRALTQQDIRVFRDDEELERGGTIAPKLLNAIEESRFSIIIFSKNYASSRWCLNELVKIMECKEKGGHQVVPIFYHVDPSDVRKQTGSFGEAFVNHEKEAKEKMEKIQRWRSALAEAGNISGWHLDKGYEGEFIKEVTKDILGKLNRKLLHVGENIVGMNARVEEMKSLINIELSDVRMVGIYGIGGIGKTTIAKAVCNEIAYKFEGISFLENVREKSKDPRGLLQLQRQLLDDILKGVNLTILSCVDEGKCVIKERFHSKNVLVILDDVDHLDQLKSLAGSCGWFGSGSKIIITTRNKHLLVVHGVHKSYKAKQLTYNDALQLFSLNAFKQNLPKESYGDLSNCMVDYAKALPLALKVLGTSLFNKTIGEWKCTLHKLKRKPNMEIQNVLRISFDGLDDMEKEIFLDIACFFNGQNEDFVTKILDECNFYGNIGIRVLSDRCLITLVDGAVHMHDLLQEMGLEIVRQEWPREPGKWSRLWEPEDIYGVICNEVGTERIEGIFLDMSKSKDILFTVPGFKMMRRLRLLKVYWSDRPLLGEDNKVLLQRNFEFPSQELRYMHWERFPLRFLPSNFLGMNLVELYLQSSNIEQLWEGSKGLVKLKVIDLSHSQKLIKMPKFSSMPNLERLDLHGCTSLKELHSSIGVLTLLHFLNLSGCKRLLKFPNNSKLVSLKVLYLNGCQNFEQFLEVHVNMGRLKELQLNAARIKELPGNIEYSTYLQVLSLCGCRNLEKLPEIHGMSRLRELHLSKSGIKELPSGIECLEALEILSLTGCSNFEKFPEVQRTMGSLKCLLLGETAIKELPFSIDHLATLEYLNLENCNNLRSLPRSISGLKYLKCLSLRGCLNLEAFPEIMEDMEQLEHLYFNEANIKEIPSSIGFLRGLRSLELINC